MQKPVTRQLFQRVCTESVRESGRWFLVETHVFENGIVEEQEVMMMLMMMMIIDNERYFSSKGQVKTESLPEGASCKEAYVLMV